MEPEHGKKLVIINTLKELIELYKDLYIDDLKDFIEETDLFVNDAEEFVKKHRKLNKVL